MRYYVIWYYSAYADKVHTGWVNEWNSNTTILTDARKYYDINTAHLYCNAYNTQLPGHSVQEVEIGTQ